MKQKNRSGLWTYDFTVITIGSVISMMGASLTGFSISLIVLDHTGSTFLYTLFNVCFQLPMLICPVLAGPYLDRMSRKKVIYRLDFTSSVLFFLLFLLLRTGWFNYPVMLCGCIVIGSINGVYNVAYESFYPNLITAGNYRKAYSVSSMLWPLAAMSTPVAAALYHKLGSAAPIFAVNSLCFFTAACFERTIRHQETHIRRDAPVSGISSVRRFSADFKEGIRYLRDEKGLLNITLYFMISNACWAAENLQLPFFKHHPENFAAWPIAVVTLYSIVSNFGVAGRLAGGFLQYKIPFPKDKKYTITLWVYVINGFLSCIILFLPIPLMALTFFIQGILSVTSYTIRTAATQAYVPDSKRARFNGVFGMLFSLGSIMGNLISGALGEILPERAVITGLNTVALFMIYFFIYRPRDEVAKIYNQDV